jgi:mannose-1-phosphate guanylyltransferase
MKYGDNRTANQHPSTQQEKINIRLHRTSPGRATSANWSVILAGAQNINRLNPDHPKLAQCVCNFSALSFILNNVIEHAVSAVGSNNLITVASERQKAHFQATMSFNLPGKFVYQPTDGGSLVAVCIALAHILVKDPSARVIILPNDHFVSPKAKFTDFTSQALQLAADNPELVFLGGALPQRLSNDKEWIEVQNDSPGNETSKGSRKRADLLSEIPGKFYNIVRIHKKPDTNEADKLFSAGALLNTRIIVARAELFWNLLARNLPDLFERVAYVRNVVSHYGDVKESQDYINMAISHAFYEMPAYDLIRELVNPSISQFKVLPMNGMVLNSIDDLSKNVGQSYPDSLVNGNLKTALG